MSVQKFAPPHPFLHCSFLYCCWLSVAGHTRIPFFSIPFYLYMDKCPFYWFNLPFTNTRGSAHNRTRQYSSVLSCTETRKIRDTHMHTAVVYRWKRSNYWGVLTVAWYYYIGQIKNIWHEGYTWVKVTKNHSVCSLWLNRLMRNSVKNTLAFSGSAKGK